MGKLIALTLLAVVTTAYVRDHVTHKGETITYAASGCFSGCEPFLVVVQPDGHGTITQFRRTASFQAIPRDLRAFAADLDKVRPDHELRASDGIPDCRDTATDRQSVQIIWQGQVRRYRRIYDYGCRDPDKQKVGAILSAAIPHLPVPAHLAAR